MPRVNVKSEWCIENILKLLNYSTDPLSVESEYSLVFPNKNIVR